MPRRGPDPRALLLLPLLFAAPPHAAHAEAVVSGPAMIVDGDTIEVDGRRIDLFNIDAPEPGQTCGNPDGGTYPCGTVAAQNLALLIAGREVTCALHGKDRTAEGPSGICSAGEDQLNRLMVMKGWALVRRSWKYHEDYLKLEAQAREQRRGVWRGPFVKPWRWKPEKSSTD